MKSATFVPTTELKSKSVRMDSIIKQLWELCGASWIGSPSTYLCKYVCFRTIPVNIHLDAPGHPRSRVGIDCLWISLERSLCGKAEWWPCDMRIYLTHNHQWYQWYSRHSQRLSWGNGQLAVITVRILLQPLALPRSKMQTCAPRHARTYTEHRLLTYGNKTPLRRRATLYPRWL